MAGMSAADYRAQIRQAQEMLHGLRDAGVSAQELRAQIGPALRVRRPRSSRPYLGAGVKSRQFVQSNASMGGRGGRGGGRGGRGGRGGGQAVPRQAGFQLPPDGYNDAMGPLPDARAPQDRRRRPMPPPPPPPSRAAHVRGRGRGGPMSLAALTRRPGMYAPPHDLSGRGVSATGEHEYEDDDDDGSGSDSDSVSEDDEDEEDGGAGPSGYLY